MDDILLTAVEFLEDHRYDPSEIYEEEFVDDIKDIPSPKRDPNSIIEDFQNILHTMGKSFFPTMKLIYGTNLVNIWSVYFQKI